MKCDKPRPATRSKNVDLFYTCQSFRRHLEQRVYQGQSLGVECTTRLTFMLESNPDFSRRAMLLNAQISGICVAT